MVVDASVVVKWFVEEVYTDKALKLRDDPVDGLIGVAAPQLLTFGLLNSLKYNPAFGLED